MGDLPVDGLRPNSSTVGPVDCDLGPFRHHNFEAATPFELILNRETHTNTYKSGPLALLLRDNPR